MTFEKIEKYVNLAKGGDEVAKEMLAEEFKPLIFKLSNKTFIDGFDTFDIRNECYVTLFKCVEQYDVSKHRFVAYATNAIKNTVRLLVRNALNKASTDGKECLVLDDCLDNLLFIEEDEDSSYYQYYGKELLKAIASLSVEDQFFLKYIFKGRHTLKQYAAITKCPYSKAHRRKKLILKTLREKLIAVDIY